MDISEIVQTVGDIMENEAMTWIWKGFASLPLSSGCNPKASSG
jgi:hypothetical protein